MRVKKVNRYYCDFCKKSTGTKHSMRRHEAGCTANPDRRCGMCEFGELDAADLPTLIALLPDGHEYQRRIEEKSDTNGMYFAIIDEAREATEAAMPVLREAADNCPACILAALRQSGCARFAEFQFIEERESFLDEVNNAKALDTSW